MGLRFAPPLPNTKLISAILPTLLMPIIHWNELLWLLQFYGTYCFILSTVLFNFFLWVKYYIFVWCLLGLFTSPSRLSQVLMKLQASLINNWTWIFGLSDFLWLVSPALLQVKLFGEDSSLFTNPIKLSLVWDRSLNKCAQVLDLKSTNK